MRIFSIAFIGGMVGTVFTSALVIAWTGPTSAPPNGNVAAPLNVGTTAQVKNGGLSVNQLAVFGNATLTGSFGIKTTSPAYPLDVNGGSRITGNLLLSGASRYLNFGTATSSAGYGIRDNAGTMEFRNSNGQWRSLLASTGVTSIQFADGTTQTTAAPAGGVTGYTLASCSPYQGGGTCVATCPSGYYRSGCSYASGSALPSDNGCKCSPGYSYGSTCYAYCVK